MVMKKPLFYLLVSFFLIMSIQAQNTNQGIVKTRLKTIKKEVPILCYHNIKDFGIHDTEFRKTYTVQPIAFAQQMKALHDKGFHTILPDQLLGYLKHNKSLPSNPIMITFDDTHEEHYSIAASELKKYGFKGVFFIMTVSINSPKYMSKSQIIDLVHQGHVIGAHTWNHEMVTKYKDKDWGVQLSKPQQVLQTITNKPIHYFAYPFGIWNQAAITGIKKRGYDLAFILSTKKDTANPSFTVRRMIVSGTWTTPRFLKAIAITFK